MGMNIRQAVSLKDAQQLRKSLKENSNPLIFSREHALAWRAFDLLMSQKLYGDADQLAKILLPSNPEIIKLYICRLKALGSEGNHSEFESLLKQALRVKPKSYSLLCIGSRELQMMGRYELSLFYAKQCLGKKKATPKVYMTILECQLACGLFDDSDHVFRQAFQMVDLQATKSLASSKKKINSESKLLAVKKSLQKLKFQHLGARIVEARSLWSHRSIPKTYRCDVFVLPLMRHHISMNLFTITSILAFLIYLLASTIPVIRLTILL